MSFRDEARLLTIRDESDKGKSALLKYLRYKCQFGNPPVAVSLVPLNELQPKTTYALVQYVVDALRGFGCEFPEFRAVEDERIDRRLGAIADAIGTVQAGEVSGGEVAGVKVEGDATFNVSGTVDPDVQGSLRARAVEAFVADLRRVTAERPVVILLDTYEQCGRALEQWVPSFLQGNLFDPDGPMEKLIVVIAGQRVPSSGFRLMLGPRYDSVVKSVESLSLWEREHVKAFLDVQGVKGYSDVDVDYIYASLQGGRSIGSALRAVRQFLREEAG